MIKLVCEIWGWLVCFTPRRLYPVGISSLYPSDRRLTGHNEPAWATFRRGFPGTVCWFSRVAARWPVQTTQLPVRGLRADRTDSCTVLLIVNGGSRDERSNYTLGALPKGRNRQVPMTFWRREKYLLPLQIFDNFSSFFVPGKRSRYTNTLSRLP
jgi:hypothetical protein